MLPEVQFIKRVRASLDIDVRIDRPIRCATWIVEIGKRCAVRTKPLARQTLRVPVGRSSFFDRFAFAMQKE
jgi:hypothetical protein